MSFLKEFLEFFDGKKKAFWLFQYFSSNYIWGYNSFLEPRLAIAPFIYTIF